MKVYKVFYKKKGRWEGPYFNRPKSWPLRPGAKWKSYVNRTNKECGRGINFYITLVAAINAVDVLYHHFIWSIWELEIPHNVKAYGCLLAKRRSSTAIVVRKVSSNENEY